MDTLTISYQGQMITIPMEIKEKHFSEPDYIFYGKKGISLYHFRKEDNVWKLAYGTMPADMRDAIIKALSDRFDQDQ